MKRRHIYSIAVFVSCLVALSILYGMGVLAGKTKPLTAVGVKATVPDKVFVGTPRSREHLSRCQIIGRPSKKNPYYYLRNEVNMNKMAFLEIYCFASEKDAQNKGFKYRKPPENLKPSPGITNGIASTTTATGTQ